jgi:hypothetical protein
MINVGLTKEKAMNAMKRYPKGLVTNAIKNLESASIYIQNTLTGEEEDLAEAIYSMRDSRLPAIGSRGSMEDLHNDLKTAWQDSKHFLVSITLETESLYASNQ